MRVFIGTDHAGLEFKEHLKQALSDAGHEPVDCGAFEYDAQDDYPPFCFAVGERTVAEPGSLGVVIGGSGNGEQIAANKVPGVAQRLLEVFLELQARVVGADEDAHAGESVRLPRWRSWGSTGGAAGGSAPCSTAVG